MEKLKIRGSFAVLAMLALLTLAACGGDPTPTPPPPTPTTAPTATAEPPTPTVEASSNSSTSNDQDAIDLLNDAQRAMQGVKSYHFVLETSSAGTEVKAEGDIHVTEKKLRMSMTVPGMGDIEMISIANDTYFKQPGTDAFTKAGDNDIMANALSGMSDPMQFTSYTEFAEEAQVAGKEKLDGADTVRVTYTFDANKAAQEAAEKQGQPTPEAIGEAKSSAEMWIEEKTNFIRKMEIITLTPDPTSTDANADPIEVPVTITLSNINEDITPPIEEPENATEMPGLTDAATPEAEETTTPGAQPTTATSGSTNNQGTGGEVIAMKQAGELHGMKVTINSVRYTEESFIEPDPGNEYCVVNLTLENLTAEDKAASSLLQFSVADDTNTSYDVALVAEIDLIDSKTTEMLKQGKPVTGEAAFQIPKNAKGLVFTYKSLFPEGTLRFKLDR